MAELYTPKQVARAMDVSESSVKRWCDKGVIATRYTAGGHRRIARSDLLEFLRGNKYELAQPEALGLPATSGRSARVLDRALDELTEALLAGDEARCRQVAIDLYLAEHRISVICDEVFAAAFRRIGDRWAHREAEIYQERRGCEITLRVLHELRSLLPVSPERAPLAIGGTPTGDQYQLGTTMTELVLCDAKWQSISLGDNLPFETIAAAIRKHQPRLFWLSCSHIDDRGEFLANYRDLYQQFGLSVAFVVGGFALRDDLRQEMQYAAYCDNMQHLEGFAQTLLGAMAETSPKS